LSTADLETYSLARDPELEIEPIRQRYSFLKRSPNEDIDGPAKSPKIAEDAVPRPAKPPETDGSAISSRVSPRYWERLNEDAVREWTSLNAERATLFDSLADHKYRLHAVICHTGTAKAGHYWVWIHDFGKKVWRKYNDTTVTEVPEDNFTGQLQDEEPYYLAYVREQGLDSLVNVPPRHKPEPAATDVEMVDMAGTSEHVENAGKDPMAA
jgi:ubiquitin carboxyl-terminal hydrolase 25